jgi:FtsH-binding integral membrane protein
MQAGIEGSSMETVGRFVLGGVFALVGILGLGLAAGHEDGGFHVIGLLIFLICIGLLFAQIADVAHGRGTSGSALPSGPILRNFTRMRERGDGVLRTMGAIEKFLIGGVLGLFAIVSLFVASRHGEGASYWGGIVFFVICIGLIFYQITGAKPASGGDAH